MVKIRPTWNREAVYSMGSKGRKLRDIPWLKPEDFQEINDKAMSARVHIGRQLVDEMFSCSDNAFVSFNDVLNAALVVAMNHKKELDERLYKLEVERRKLRGGGPGYKEDLANPEEPRLEPDYSQEPYKSLVVT